ncbi:MAG: hypothetical protein AAGF11_52950 [Myxococcota bacterium]
MMMDEPGLGVSGWVTVVVYLLVARLCLRAFMVEKAGPKRPYIRSIAALWRVVKKHWPNVPIPARRAGLWVCLALVLIVLGVNRLFDLETLVLDAWREDSRLQGTYGERRAMQGGFIGAVAIMGLAVVVVLFRIARGQLTDFRLMLGGAVYLLAFVVIRAASLHAVDGYLDQGIAGIRLGVGLELLGLVVIGMAAYRRLRKAKAAQPKGTTSASASASAGRRPTATHHEPRPSAGTRPATRPPTRSATRPPTRSATRPPTRSATRPPTRPPTGSEAPKPGSGHRDESAPIRITQLS